MVGEVEVHGHLTLSANVRLLETKYKRSKIVFDVTPIAFTDIHICTELLQIPAQSLIGSPGTLLPRQAGPSLDSGSCTTLE